MDISKLTRVMKKLENVTRKTKRIWIGIDVHKKSYAVAVYGDGRVLKRWSMPSDIAVLLRMLLPFRDMIMRVVYEAGPTGYHLARELENAGIRVGVVATSRLFKQNDESKTDTIDACGLAEHAFKNILTFVTIPTEEEEEDRQVTRLEQQVMKKRNRVMVQIRSFLLQHDIQLDEDCGRWTCAFIASLKCVELRPGLRFTLDEYLRELESLKLSLKQISEEQKRVDMKHKDVMEILTSHPGVGIVTARLFSRELFRPERFRNSKCVARMLGFAPGLHETGGKKKRRGVLAAGLGRLRATLIQATWVWVNGDGTAHSKYVQLLQRTGSAQKAIVAMARRLSTHLWNMLIKQKPFDSTLASYHV